MNWDFVSKLFEMKTKTKLLENKITKQIMTESKSYIAACSTEDEKFFQKLMTDNEISKIYGTGIYSVLKNVPWLKYQPKNIQENTMQGFYKDSERHDISYLAGNYRAFCLITKSVNNLLKQNGYKPILLKDKTKEEQILGVKKLIRILSDYSHKIFTEDSPFFKSIMSNLGNSKNKGERVENLTKKRLDSQFGENNVEIKSGFGSESDNLGLDGEITDKEKKHSIQIKPLTNYEIKQDKVFVHTTGKILSYSQDWMVFSNKFETIILKNDATEMGDSTYIFPVSSLIYTLA